MAYQVRRLRVLPEDNTSLPIQVCERLDVRLTIAACAARWSKAETYQPDVRIPTNSRYAPCAGCPIGQKNERAMRVREAMRPQEAQPHAVVRGSERAPAIDVPTARRLGVEAESDHRSVLKELLKPGSVRGVAGKRIRAVLALHGLATQPEARRRS